MTCEGEKPSCPRRVVCPRRSALGNSSAAIAQMSKALELDPLSPLYNTVMGLTYYFAGRYEAARAPRGCGQSHGRSAGRL
jgi:hypothetical protein